MVLAHLSKLIDHICMGLFPDSQLIFNFNFIDLSHLPLFLITLAKSSLILLIFKKKKTVFLFVCLFCFLGPNPWHMEDPRLGVLLEPQLPAYIIATATQDPNHIYNLHYSSQQCWILNPLGEARDQTHILMDSSQIPFHWTMTGPPAFIFFFLSY